MQSSGKWEWEGWCLEERWRPLSIMLGLPTALALPTGACLSLPPFPLEPFPLAPTLIH